MSDSKHVPNLSANLKKAVCWISEVVQEHPEKRRNEIMKEAELRFDLSPLECEFLNKNFSELSAKCDE